jgi:hypothetical protein
MRILLVFILSLFAAAIVSAQEATPEETPEPYTLAEESHQLDWFIGAWSVDSRYLLDPATEEWFEETVTSTIEPIIGGFALMERYTGTFAGTPIDAVSIRTYNSAIGKWQQRWLDNTSPGFAAYTGQYADGEFIAYADRGYSPEIEGGTEKETGAREIFFDIEADRFSWRWETTADGGATWTTVWTLEYTRVS